MTKTFIMKLKLLCSIICGIFMGFSSLLYAQATEVATEVRDLSGHGASVTDVYFRHIDNRAWLDTENNKTIKSPIERVRVLSPYEAKVAIVGKFNFVPLDNLLKTGDFVRVPLPSNVTLITKTYEIYDSKGNVIGHIVADNTKNYITFVFNPKIEYRTNVEGNFSIGAVLKAPVGDTTVTLDKGPLQEYSYINDQRTNIYRGGDSVTITNIYKPSDVKDKDDAPCQDFWDVRGEGTGIDEHLTWTMNFNMNKYSVSASSQVLNITNKDYGTKKVIFKLFGNAISSKYENRQSFLPFIRDSFEFYEANVADGSIIGDKLKLFTDATEFANYTGTEQAGLITFNKSDYEVTIELKHGVGTKAYKVVYKTDNPADATYVGSKVMVNVDGQDTNYRAEGCEDNQNYYFNVIPTSLPLGVDANTDWANRLFMTKYKKEEENGAILPAERVSFTLNKFVAGSDTEIDTAFPTITLTTDAKGKAKSTKLSAGKYILKETILPKGGGYMPYVEKFEVIENNEEPILKTIINTKERISYSFSGTGFRKYFPNLPAGSQYPEVSLNVKVTYAKDKDKKIITNPTVINIPVTIPAGTLEEGKNYVDFEPLKNIIKYDEYGNELKNTYQLIFEITEPTPPAGYTPEYNYGNNPIWIANYKEEANNTIQIYKYLDGNSSKAGEGAIFTIEKLDASGAVDTSFAKVTLTTGANGFAISETLTAGDYLLKEIRPANQIYTKSKPNPDPKATPEVEYKYEIEGGVYKISDEYRKGVKVTIVDGKTNLIKVNNESVPYGVWTRKGKKIWKGAKSVATKPEVRLRVKLTYKPNKNDAEGNPYPESVRILKPIIAAGTPTTDKDGNEEVEFEYRIPNIDFYGNNYTSAPEVAIEEENIPGYKSEVDDSTYKIDKIIKVINTLAPPVVRVNPNLRMRISEDH